MCEADRARARVLAGAPLEPRSGRTSSSASSGARAPRGRPRAPTQRIEHLLRLAQGVLDVARVPRPSRAAARAPAAGRGSARARARPLRAELHVADEHRTRSRRARAGARRRRARPRARTRPPDPRSASSSQPLRHAVEADRPLERVPDGEEQRSPRTAARRAAGRPAAPRRGRTGRSAPAGPPCRRGSSAGRSGTSRAGSPSSRRARNATVGDVGETSASKRSNARVVLALDHGPHLLRLAVVGVVVAGRERVRADHDPALRLVAEALVARALVHVESGRRPRRRGSRSGRRRSARDSTTPRPGRSGSSRRSRTRPRAAASTPPPRRRACGRARSRAATASRTPGSIPSASFSSRGTPIAHALQVLAPRAARTGRVQLDRGRVALVASGDDRVEERAVADGARDRPDLVEARREGDDAVARDGAVGRAQADVAAERRRLLDRAARVGAERPRGEARGHGRRRAAARAAGHARRGPTGCASARRRSSRSRSPSRTRPCSSCRAPRRPARLEPRGDGRVVDRHVALEDLRARGRRDPLRPDHVFERDRDALADRPRRREQVAVQLGSRAPIASR